MPGNRGAFEISSGEKAYLDQDSLTVERGFAWLVTRDPCLLIRGVYYIQTMKHRQGLKVACLEKIAESMGYIQGNNYWCWQGY